MLNGASVHLFDLSARGVKIIDLDRSAPSGDIRMVLHGGHIAVNGRRSAESLYDFNLATYDEGDTFDQSSAKGFVHVHGLSSKDSSCAVQTPWITGGWPG